MKRRDFVKGAGAAVAGDLLLRTEATAQGVSPTPLQPSRTTRLVNSSLPVESTVCQDVIYDGSHLLCLYGSTELGPYSISAAKPSGELSWNYPLPGGPHVSIGTYQGSVLIFESPRPSFRSPIRVLDPGNGAARKVGEYDRLGPLFYSGDTLLFGTEKGCGEVWKFDGGLTRVHVSEQRESYSVRLRCRQLAASDTFAIATQNAAFITRLSVGSGVVQESALTGEFLSSVRSFYEAARNLRIAQNRLDVRRASGPVTITAIGVGDSSVYALVVVPSGPRGVYGLVAIDEIGNSTLVAKIQVPDLSAFTMGLVVIGSEVGVICHNGNAMWYPLPV